MVARRIIVFVLYIALLTGIVFGGGGLNGNTALGQTLTSGSDGENFAVASSSAEAAKVGMEVLRRGGNAVDAAVAVSLTLAVVEPYASGLGGGGYMLIYDPSDGTAWSLDYFPASGSAPENTDLIGIPGLLKGMQAAQDQWGTMSLSDLIQPAIDYAENGFSASNTLIRRLSMVEEVKQDPVFSNLSVGKTVYQPELARTLRLIQENGIDAFYSGQIAEDIASVSELTVEDLTNYQVYLEPAIQTEAFGYTLYGTYAPSSAITTMQMVKLAEMLDMPSPDSDTAGYMAALKTITQAAYQSRKRTLTDPRLYSWDYRDYLTEDYLTEQVDSVESVTGSDPEKKSTTQFSIIDSNGMTVCVTNSLSDNWGSYTKIDGFYLNNTLSLFGTSSRIAYAPDKRPRTHFSPIIMIGNTGEIMAIGSPGGSNIPRIVASVLIDILKFGTDVQSAVDKSRVMVDEQGYACVEAPDSAPSIVTIDQIPFGYYYSGSHMYFGCTSIVGYSLEKGVYCVNDSRRVSSDTASAIEHFFGW